MPSQGVGGMAEHPTFTGFFSYAHHDAKINPSLISDFTVELEGRVASKLTNARFEIWRDKEGLRTGNRWNEKIEAELRHAHVLIVLLTPRWIDSDYCRREYLFFEEIEASREIGEYVSPILARPIEQQEQHFTREQKDVHDKIANRQYFKAINFLNLTKAKRNSKIEELADDIAGMIDRLRQPAPTFEPSATTRQNVRLGRGTREFGAGAEDYAKVDFLRTAAVLIEPSEQERERGVYAQVDFVERLFVRGTKADIKFGIQHAHLIVVSAAPGQLRKIAGFHLQDVDRAAYVSVRDAPEAVSVAMYASPGRALADLALPPTNNNYWSQIATASPEVRSDQLRAELRVALSPYGLHLPDARGQPLSNATRRKIEAIIGVALGKHERVAQDGQICRSVPIQESTL
jgi:hypothetical protein